MKYFSPLDLCNVCIVPDTFDMQLWVKAWILVILWVIEGAAQILYSPLGGSMCTSKSCLSIFWSYVLLPWKTWEQLCAQLSGEQSGCRLLTCQQFSECSLCDHNTGNCCCLHCCRFAVKALIRLAGSAECVASLWFVVWVGKFSGSKRAHAHSTTST